MSVAPFSRFLANSFTVDRYVVHSNLLVGLLGYGSAGSVYVDNVTATYLSVWLSKHAAVADCYPRLVDWLTGEEAVSPILMSQDAVDVEMRGRDLVDEYYSLVRDKRVDVTLKRAMFCNAHRNTVKFDMPQSPHRMWSIPTYEPPPGIVLPHDKQYAALGVIQIILSGAARGLYEPATGGDKTSTSDMQPFRFAPRMTDALYVPRLAAEIEPADEEEDKQTGYLPLSHSKDEPVARLPTHECIVLGEDPPSCVCKDMTPLSPSHRGQYSDDAVFMGRFERTKTAGMCRFCLDPSDEPLKEVLGCACTGTEIGMSHESCLRLLATKGLLRADVCCACLQRHNSPTRVPPPHTKDQINAPKPDPVDVPMLNTWHPVSVGRVPERPREVPQVVCACCGRVGRPRYWLYLGYPVHHRWVCVVYLRVLDRMFVLLDGDTLSAAAGSTSVRKSASAFSKVLAPTYRPSTSLCKRCTWPPMDLTKETWRFPRRGGRLPA